MSVWRWTVKRALIFENVEICAEDDVANAAVVCNYNPYFIIWSVYTHTHTNKNLFYFVLILYFFMQYKIKCSNKCAAAVDIRECFKLKMEDKKLIF